jgi:hypothetical protein
MKLYNIVFLSVYLECHSRVCTRHYGPWCLVEDLQWSIILLLLTFMFGVVEWNTLMNGHLILRGLPLL